MDTETFERIGTSSLRRRIDTNLIERVAKIEARLDGITELIERMRRIEEKLDDAMQKLVIANAKLLSMQEDINRAHRKIEGIYGRIWAAMTASITALVSVVWSFLKKGLP